MAELTAEQLALCHGSLIEALATAHFAFARVPLRRARPPTVGVAPARRPVVPSGHGHDHHPRPPG